jgi:hypothetical protein
VAEGGLQTAGCGSTELADRLRDLLTLEDYNPLNLLALSGGGLLDELDFLSDLSEAVD